MTSVQFYSYSTTDSLLIIENVGLGLRFGLATSGLCLGLVISGLGLGFVTFGLGLDLDLVM